MTPERAKELLPAITAHANEKPVRFREKGKKLWSITKYPIWQDEYDYEPAPTPVPPGDLTWEEAEALLKQGVPVQFYDPVDKEWVSKEQKTTCLGYAYRRTPAPPAPQKKRVPLGPEDIKSTTQFRLKTVMKQVGATEEGVNVVPAVIRWADLATCFERTDDDGATWGPCSKIVEEVEK